MQDRRVRRQQQQERAGFANHGPQRLCRLQVICGCDVAVQSTSERRRRGERGNVTMQRGRKDALPRVYSSGGFALVLHVRRAPASLSSPCSLDISSAQRWVQKNWHTRRFDVVVSLDTVYQAL